MKIKGEFILREIVGETILVPVGATALEYNGMIIINDTGAYIWKALEQNTPKEEILSGLTDTYDVSEEEAKADLDEFLDTLEKAGILER